MGKVMKGIVKAEFTRPHLKNKDDSNVLCSEAANEGGMACGCSN